jgi:large subunit ribosomal protein L4
MITAASAAVDSPERRRVRPAPAVRTVERRRIDGSVIDSVALDPEIFGLAPNDAVLHQVVTGQLAAARAGTQSTRTRSEVAGGGAKPFRQKGTGRARQGSIRAPQWSGGGVALGPKPRSYRQRTPKKMIRLALYSALSDRAEQGRVVVVDTWSFPAPRTKDAVGALSALGLSGRVLVVLDPEDGIPDRSFANLPDVQTLQRAELNAYDVVRSDWVVFTDATLPGDTAPAPETATGATAPRRTRRARTEKAAAAPEDAPARRGPTDGAAAEPAGDDKDAANDTADGGEGAET